MDSPTGSPAATDKAAFYRGLCEQLDRLIGDETNLIANAANTSALLFQLLPDVNWVGFYLLDDDELVLGPFQGKPACTRIAVGTGVCGTAAATAETVIVPDVHEFPGHIACDTASRSEIVVPLLNWGTVAGVLDIDSPVLNRFDEDDRDGIESLVSVFLASQGSGDLPDLNAGEAGSGSVPLN